MLLADAKQSGHEYYLNNLILPRERFQIFLQSHFLELITQVCRGAGSGMNYDSSQAIVWLHNLYFG